MGSTKTPRISLQRWMWHGTSKTICGRRELLLALFQLHSIWGSVDDGLLSLISFFQVIIYKCYFSRSGLHRWRRPVWLVLLALFLTRAACTALPCPSSTSDPTRPQLSAPWLFHHWGYSWHCKNIYFKISDYNCFDEYVSHFNFLVNKFRTTLYNLLVYQGRGWCVDRPSWYACGTSEWSWAERCITRRYIHVLPRHLCARIATYWLPLCCTAVYNSLLFNSIFFSYLNFILT